MALARRRACVRGQRTCSVSCTSSCSVAGKQQPPPDTVPHEAVLAGRGLSSPLLVAVLQLVRPPPGRCGLPYTWQPPVGGPWGHGCGRQSPPGWSQIVGPHWCNAPSRRLRGTDRPAGWVSQSEELCGPCFFFTLERAQPCKRGDMMLHLNHLRALPRARSAACRRCTSVSYTHLRAHETRQDLV